MEFIEKKGIYKQIGDTICEQIINNIYREGDKIPSVREQAGILQVNQNTVMRTYQELLREGVLVNKRGIGFFVAESATKIIIDDRKIEFFSTIVPEFIKQIKLLAISKEEVDPIVDQINKLTTK